MIELPQVGQFYWRVRDNQLVEVVDYNENSLTVWCRQVTNEGRYFCDVREFTVLESYVRREHV